MDATLQLANTEIPQRGERQTTEHFRNTHIIENSTLQKLHATNRKKNTGADDQQGC